MQEVPAETVQRLILAAAPERKQELLEMWEKHAPTFHVVEDQPGTTYAARGKRVVFDHKSVAHDWLIGFAAWRALRAYSAPIMAAGLAGCPIGTGLFASDSGLEEAEAALQELLYTAGVIRSSRSLADLEWPQDVPQLAPSGDGFEVEDKAAFDLISIALTAIFLHELHHVRVHSDGETMVRIDEERACDAFARDFLLERVDEYAKSTGESATAVRAKRAMGLVLAAYIIHESTPISQQSGTDWYPSTIARLTDFASATDVPENSAYWIFATSIVIAILRRRGGLRMDIQFTSYRDAFQKMLDEAKRLVC